jgi:polysaccharide biosynthesis transport protein
MTPRQVLAILAARWWLALLVLLLAVAGTAAVSMTMFKRYTASASVMLDARSPEQVVAGGSPSSSLPGGYMATQMDLIMSERVGRAVIRSLDLARDDHLRDAWQQAGEGRGDFEAWLAESLQQNLAVKPAPVSNIITISYSSDDPAKAAQLANVYVKAYIETALEIRMERVRQYGTFFDERAKDLRASLESAQSKLSDFQQKNSLVTGTGDEKFDKLDIETARLSELVAQSVQLQGSNAEVAGRMRRAGRQTDQLQEVWRNPAVAALNAEITTEEVRLREMTDRLGGSHPQLIAQETRLSELKSQLVKERARTASNLGFDNGANQSRLAQVTAALETQRAKVLGIQRQREQAATLQREVDNAQRAYDTMLQRVSQSSIESQNTFTNVAVLKNASVPMAPSSPNLLKNIAASLALGALLGLGAALGVEMMDRRMRTVDDFVQIKNSVLVSLPLSKHDKQRLPDTSRVRLMKQRVMTGLPRPTPQT